MPSRDGNDSQKELLEKREVARDETHTGAYIVCHGSPSIRDCRILDMSPKGARLWLADTTSVPKFFELHTPEGEAYLCELKRTKADHVGVQFLERS